MNTEVDEKHPRRPARRQIARRPATENHPRPPDDAPAPAVAIAGLEVFEPADLEELARRHRLRNQRTESDPCDD